MDSNKKIHILLADDHVILREGISAILSMQPDIEVVGEAGDGQAVVDQALALRPDVILMDLMMPVKDGLTAINEIKSLNINSRILVLTSFADDERVFPAIKAGALGYLLKDSTRAQLVQAIRDVAGGRASLHPAIALKVMREINGEGRFGPSSGELPVLDPLTERELETLQLIAQGMSNQDIADALVINERTVAKYVSSILEKLHLANRTQAALYALRQGLAKLD